MSRFDVRVAILAVASLSTASLAQLGDLNPPGGPVTETGPTLQQIEPRIEVNAENTPGDADSRFKITARGSYYLTGDVQGGNGLSGIEIAAADVTLDLNGFTLRGTSNSLNGIETSNGAARLTIFNGKIRNWPFAGCDLDQAEGTHLRDLHASGNLSGFRIADGSLIERCIASGNTIDGFEVTGGSSVFELCIATGNGNDGFDAARSVLRGCSANDNDGDGFDLGNGSFAAGCSATGNLLNGFDVGNESRVESCLARDNTRVGFDLNNDGTIVNSTAAGNGGIGMQGGNRATIIGNNVSGSPAGVAGIQVSGNDGRIDSNTLTNCGVGVEVTSDGTGNLITRNAVIAAIGNAFDISTGNALAEIQGVNLTNSQVQGSSGGGFPRNRNWGNFAY